jgi:hypothetical protein
MINMDCKDFQNSLFTYAEGELAPETRDAMAAHNKDCRSCSKLLEGFLALQDALEAEKGLEPDPFLSTRILQRLENAKEKGHRPALPVLRPVLVTLVLLAALVSGYLVGNQGNSRKSLVSAGADQIEVLKADFFVHDIADEDLSLLTNY